VLNPQDFHRLTDLDDALTEAEQISPSDLARRAHQIEDTPAGPVEDGSQIDNVLGL